MIGVFDKKFDLSLFQDGTSVTEPCTTVVDTCTDMNADCNGTICDCVSGFHWNGSVCGKIALKYESLLTVVL